ncbi:MAG: UDP-glucose 4-epimerase GalE [Pelagibacteraceae bacterium]
MKNVLITGGAGYIGSHITELLIKKKLNIVIIDNLSSGYKRLINKKAKFYNLDINNYIKLKNIIISNDIDSVIHLAANLDVNESQLKPKKYYRNNVLGTFNLIKACKKANIKNFIFSSTAAVYKDKIFKVSELSPVKPKSIYGKTKLKAENLIKKHFKKHNINYVILRYFNIVGSSNSKKIGQINKYNLLFKNLSIAVLKKKPMINIYGNNYNTKDGTSIRDFIHVSDISNIHFLALSKINKVKKSFTLNCGYGQGRSVLEVVKLFEKISKKKIKINFESRRKADLEQIIANVSKLKKLFKWKPKFNNLPLMIKSSIQWQRKIKNINVKY